MTQGIDQYLGPLSGRVSGVLYSKRTLMFRVCTLAVGAALILISLTLLSNNGSASAFFGGLAFLTGFQILTWSLGLRLEILSNVPEESDYSLQDGTPDDYSRYEASQRLSEYYEATRTRAGELYSQAAESVGEVAREAAARRTGTVAAAIDAGRKAYQEEKRKTELSGRIEGAQSFDEKKPN